MLRKVINYSNLPLHRHVTSAVALRLVDGIATHRLLFRAYQARNGDVSKFNNDDEIGV